MKTKLLLFDIDGTLLTSGGAGERALGLALLERFGHNDTLSTIEIAGRTDSGIARRIFEKHGVEPTPENITKFLDGYVQHLKIELHLSKGRLLPGIIALLDALKLRPHLALALLTGNLERGAEIKLTHYRVWDYFEFGAFADDHHDRNELGKFAKARAFEKHGVEFSPENIFVIGDTPHDIDCGRAIGAKTVAIATGSFSSEQLAAHQPDYLFNDLSDTEKVISRLGW